MKKKIQGLLKQALLQLAIEESVDASIVIERPRDRSHGDFSTNLALILAKSQDLAPKVFAERLVACIPHDPDLEKITIAGPGFINFTFTPQCLQHELDMMWSSAQCGIEALEHPQTIIIDYSSPNLAKEMHVGHLRSTIIGDAIVRIFELKGYRIIRQNHVGDWGTQFGMLLAHLADEEHAHPDEVNLNDLEAFYQAAKKRFDNEPDFVNRARQQVVALQSGDEKCLALWEKFIHLSLSHCQAVYERLGVLLTPADVRAESAYNDVLPAIVERLRQQGLLIEHDGAQCVFLEEFKSKDNTVLPIIVQKKDGGFLYASTDLAAIHYRQTTCHADRILYVVDARQSLHFQQLFALAYKAGFASPTTRLEHISFGMVLDQAGKPFKSRDGGVIKLADLLDEAEQRAEVLMKSRSGAQALAHDANIAKILGISSLKYADLSKNRTQDYMFDWDSMLSFDGDTAPYLLYAYARIQSLFQKATTTPKGLEHVMHPVIFSSAHDLMLAKQLLRFPEVIDLIVQKVTPHLLCHYLYDLASIFSSFYEACPILSQKDETLKMSRLKLATLTARILQIGLSALGIQTLQQM